MFAVESHRFFPTRKTPQTVELIGIALLLFVTVVTVLMRIVGALGRVLVAAVAAIVRVLWRLRLVPAAPAAGDQADGDQTDPEADQWAACGSGSGQVRGSAPGGLGGREFGLGSLGVL